MLNIEPKITTLINTYQFIISFLQTTFSYVWTNLFCVTTA